MTYDAFVSSVKQMAFPDNEALNLAYNHSRYILDALILLQKRVPQLRQRNFNSITFGDTFYQCRATIINPKPSGPLLRIYTYTEPDHCDRVYYFATTREHMEILMRTCRAGISPTGSLVGPEPLDFYPALGDVSVPANVPIQNADPTIARMAFVPSALIGGTPATGTIDLVELAPAGGVTISLSSSKPTLVQVPATVTIPAGSRTGTFTIGTALTEVSQLVRISAVLGTRGLSLDLQVHNPNVSTDKGFRAQAGYYAVIGSQIYVWPHIESYEHLVIEWSGIKTAYLPADEVNFDAPIQAAVETYVRSQSTLTENCDLVQYSAFNQAWLQMVADLIWWYRKQDEPAELPWRQNDPCGCLFSTETSSGGGGGGGGVIPVPPIPITMTIYLGNAGPIAPPSYTSDQILGIENGVIGISTDRDDVDGLYEISATASGQNEFRLMCFPIDLWTGPMDFDAGAMGLPMEKLAAQTIINGIVYRIFRTTVPSVGDFTFAGNTAIKVTKT